MVHLLSSFRLRSLEGILDELRSDQLVDGVAVNALRVADSDDEFDPYSALPGAAGRGGNTGGGAGRGAGDGSRTTRPQVLTSAIRFSPTGRDWAAATTQGLQVFSLDEDMLFAPTDLDMTITPQAVKAAVGKHEYGLALNMALHLGEKNVLKIAVDAVPPEGIELVVKSVDVRMLRDLLRFLAEEVVSLHTDLLSGVV